MVINQKVIAVEERHVEPERARHPNEWLRRQLGEVVLLEVRPSGALINCEAGCD